MLFNRIKNHKGFNTLSFSLIILLYFSTDMVMAGESENLLTEISYNTIQAERLELVFSFTENISQLPAVETSTEPAFIKINFGQGDFDGNLQSTLVKHAGVKEVALDIQNGNVVATIKLDKLSVFDVALTGDKNFSIVFNLGSSAEVVDDLSSADKSFINQIESIDFRLNENNEGQVLVYLNDSALAVDVTDKLGKVNVVFHNTEISEELLYKLDVTDFGTLIQGIETFKDGRNARLLIDVESNFTFSQVQENNLFILTVVKEAEKEPSYLGETEKFTGRNIAFNFQDIPVRTALQLLADYSGFNLITGDTVTGNITLRLDGVPWDQALSIILKLKGLDKRMEGNILMVAPADELAAREAQTLQAKLQVEELAPLYAEYVAINYAKAVDFSELIKNENTSILSPRGSVSVDERTNTLLLRDTAKSIQDIKRMIAILDVPVRQVIIEARMVTVNDDVNEELGIKWGITSTDGENISSASLAGVDVARGGNVPSINDRLNVNLPVLSPDAGSIAFQVARLANGTILDLELSALEKEKKGEVIASPRITTNNQQEAYIEQGVELPYQEASSSGATTTQFRKAVLSLRVTPHITPDDKIILDLVITQDSVAELRVGFAPSINTQRIGTQVLADNGQTIVLGGIYQQEIVSTVSKIPVLGDIPYLGWMFSSSSNNNRKKELLIFVTPRIVTKNL
jgi:type IV pilus assembly protein PilQ